MESIKLLELYLLTHPEYWEYEDELAEVERLKAVCEINQSEYDS